MTVSNGLSGTRMGKLNMVTNWLLFINSNTEVLKIPAEEVATF
jgi:hypothetical protein